MQSYLLRAFVFCTLICSSATKIYSLQTDRENLLGLLSGEWISRSLYAISKLEIADLLEDGPQTIDYLAEKTLSDRESLMRVLRMLESFGVFEEVDTNVFCNTESSKLLIKSNPDSLRSLSLFYGEDIHRSLDQLLYCIQSGKPAFQLAFNQPVFSYFKENPTKAALFQEAMKEKSKAVIKSTLAAYDFSKFQKIYDIGGGYGQLMQAILTKHPQILGTVFELPEVVEKVKEQNPTYKLQAGDFFTSIPQGGDLYLLKSIIHDWDNAKAEKILKNCHKAMKPDSKLLLIEVVLQKEATYANCMDVLMLAITGGKERTLDSFKEMLDNCSLELEQIYNTTTEFSILEVRKK